MIDDSVEIEPGMLVRHDPEGTCLLYRVDAVGRDSDHYEADHALNGLRRVSYTQLEDGGFPTGTHWDKSEAQFRKYFSVEEGTDSKPTTPRTAE